MTLRLELLFNTLALYAIAAVLGTAFYSQLVDGELPCPLCLLQRLGFLALAIGPVLTLRYGPRPAHYGIIVLAALMGGAFAMRQMLLHITPGDPGYGPPLLGLHFYTWAFVIFVAAIALAGLMLVFGCREARAEPSRLASLAVWLVVVLAGLNTAGTVVECGFKTCPDNPVGYELMNR